MSTSPDVGDYVKIRRVPTDKGSVPERFWVRITELLPGTQIKGTVDNDLLFEHGFNYGDTISFNEDEIMDILPGDD